LSHHYNSRVSLQKRYESTSRRINILSSLRNVVNLSEKENILDRQWSAIETQLFSIQGQLMSRLKSSGKSYLSNLHKSGAASQLNRILGKIDLDLSTAIIFFDTYLDVLSQRKITELGRILAGCDVIAWDALNKDHPGLFIIEPPIVFCDRGFGASIIREGAWFPGNIKNPVPLLQIPYSRLSSKHELTSIIHEAGHEVMTRLDLVRIWPVVLKAELTAAGAPRNIAELFGVWSSEIGPDFWTFCSSGIAQTSTIREILALPPQNVFQLSWLDPHPPPYLRVLLSIEWCRQLWGRGEWDDWEEEWDMFYPLGSASKGVQKILQTGRNYLPTVSRILFNTRFKVLSGRRLPDLFDMSVLAPVKIKKIAESMESGKLDLTQISPCLQLAVFRMIRDKQKKFSENFIDKMMTDWLIRLGESRWRQMPRRHKTSQVISEIRL
jgi:hypothetical protein